MYISRMKLTGLKKFKEFLIEFNEKENIIVGDNESGKSTILEALNIVLLQQYKNYDKYIVKELMNTDNIKKFESSKRVEDLPEITIDLELKLDDHPNSASFCGHNHDWDNKERFGIIFSCKFDQEMKTELSEFIADGKIPFDYYQLTWKTYQGDSYNLNKKPLNFLIIDNDNIDANASYNHYNKNLFTTNHTNNEKMKIKNSFRDNLSELFEGLNFNSLTDNRKFGVNEKKIILENILTIFDNDVPIQNKGKGKENLIKTSIALERTVDKIDVIALEEPENHLSFTNLNKMLEEIKEHVGKQLIITTHESMITSGLGLKNVIFISNNESKSLKNEVITEDSDFFEKSTSNNILQFILSEKVILVEGPTEYLLIPKIFVKKYGKTLDSNNINIISCSGVSYKRYLKIAEVMNKKVLVLTDNDKSQTKVDDAISESTDIIKILMESDLTKWTWEVSLYELNIDKFTEIIDVQAKAEYKFNGVPYGQVLGKMLNNKVDTAFKMINSTTFDYEIPEYIIRGLEWLKN